MSDWYTIEADAWVICRVRRTVRAVNIEAAMAAVRQAAELESDFWHEAVPDFETVSSPTYSVDLPDET